MAMNPRLLRPRASGTTVPQFSPLGYTRLWCVTEKSTGNVSGTASSDTGYYAVKWWDNTTDIYDSGDPFSKAAAGNQRAFEIYPCDAGGTPSGQFDGFDVSGNSLTQLRAEDVSLDTGAGYTTPGNSTFIWTPYGGYFNVIPGVYVPGASEQGILSDNSLSSTALDQFYADLENGAGNLYVQGNPGIDADDPTIATAKGYTVFGSVPPSTALLLNFNGSNGSTTFTDSSPNELTVTAGGGAEISTTQSKFGGASGYFDGADSYLRVVDEEVGRLASGGSSVTMEAWVYAEGVTGTQVIWSIHGGNTGSWSASDGIETNCFLSGDTLYGSMRGTSGEVSLNTGSFPADQWVHVALCFDGATLRLFVDGSLAASSAMTAAVPDTSGTLDIAAQDGAYFWGGYIDDFRIVKGVALYTANFTPPTSQLVVYP